jgi:plasmid stabilization system protein ParE
MILRYKARALADLEAIYDYIAQDDPTAARRVVQRIVRSIGRLAIIPLSGRPGVVRGSRILAVPGLPYVVIHRVRENTVDIIAVLHSARRRRS